MTKTSWLAALLLMATWSGESAAGPRRGTTDGRRQLALAPLTHGDGYTDAQAQTFEEALLNALDATGRFKVMGRADLQGVLGLDHQKELFGCQSDSTCVAQLAGSMGIDLIAVGSIGRLGRKTQVSLRVVDSHRAEVVARAQKIVDSDDQLFESATEISVGIVREVWPEGATTASPVGPPTPPGGAAQPTAADAPAAGERPQAGPAAPAPAPVRAAGPAEEVAAPKALPTMPTLPSTDGLGLQADADVLVAYDAALKAEQAGEAHPGAAQTAWAALAAQATGNPYREMAAERAARWKEFGEKTRAFAEGKARDLDKLTKLLPLQSLSASQKGRVAANYLATYGMDEWRTVVPSLPEDVLREACAALPAMAALRAKIRVEANSPARVLIDGQPVGTTPVDLEVSPCSQRKLGASSLATGEWWEESLPAPPSGEWWLRKVTFKPIGGRYLPSNGAVRDLTTGLIWQTDAPDEHMSFENADKYCSHLTLDAASDWRLPTEEELLSIVDKRYSPTIDPVAFPKKRADRFWTTNVVGLNSQGWNAHHKVYVSFEDGTSVGDPNGHFLVDTYAARCVRSSGDGPATDGRKEKKAKASKHR